MRAISSYKKLVVYQRMMELVMLVYKETKSFPAEERYGLSSQMRRAAVSVISNFVEGYLKQSRKEKCLYLERSMTSLHELETQIDIAFNVDHLMPDAREVLVCKMGEVGYLLTRYRKPVQAGV